jgi:DnaK suppressor protein
MTKTELDAFQTILENRQTELKGRNSSRGALAVERTSDELDRIQDSQERELAISTLEGNSTFLREVRDALSRIRTNTFGICVECEEAINPKRLAAIPWASTCIVCQEAADREHGAPWSEAVEFVTMAA